LGGDKNDAVGDTVSAHRDSIDAPRQRASLYHRFYHHNSFELWLLPKVKQQSGDSRQK
jgi:hypothetical protein